MYLFKLVVSTLFFHHEFQPGHSFSRFGEFCGIVSQSRPLLLSSLLLGSVLSGCGGENPDDSVNLASSESTQVSPIFGSGEPPADNAPPDIAPIAPIDRVFAGEITDVILVTGQSNALGADTAFDVALDQPNSRVFAYTSEGWQVADLHQIWDLNWHPRNDAATDPSNNFGFHFARKVAERRSHRRVGFILVTAPGMSIDHWDYNSAFYVRIRHRVVAALNELPIKATIDGILWHQGESDWVDNEYYQNKLAAVINNFRTESWFGQEKPFICGETVEAPLNRLLMALNTDGDPWTGCVASDGLPTILDRLHFSAEGLRTLGTRYATKYLQMIER